MNRKPSKSIEVLEQALAATMDRLCAVEAEAAALRDEADDLRNTLELAKASLEKKQPTPALLMDSETAAAIISRQEKAVEDDEEYPAERFKDMPRVDIAISLARQFDGYLATGALRKILSKPGVLDSTKNVSSLASRIPANSEEFSRVWEGMYRLKSYSIHNKVPI